MATYDQMIRETIAVDDGVINKGLRALTGRPQPTMEVARPQNRSLEHFLELVRVQVLKAQKKWPAPNPNTSALSGEAGEAAEAMNKESFAEVQAECVDTAAVAARLFMEGDPFMDEYREMVGLDLSAHQ